MICFNQEIHDRLNHASRLWIFLDYDGTLAHFAPTPDVVIPDQDLINLLSRLVHQPNIHLAVISGRQLRHIRTLLPIPGIWLAGSYGIELLTPDGKQIDRLVYSSIRPLMEALKPEWQQLIDGKHNFYLEDKGWTLAIHARYASDQEAASVLAAARQLADRYANTSGLRLLGSQKFLEICPVAADKGNTVRYLLDHDPFSAALPVSIGDDDKDEKAFITVKERGGIAILVAEKKRPTNADCLLASPEAVRAWLSSLILPE